MLSIDFIMSETLDLIAPKTDVLVNPLTKEPLTLEEIEYLLTADI